MSVVVVCAGRRSVGRAREVGDEVAGLEPSSSRKNVWPAVTTLRAAALCGRHRLLGAAVHRVDELGPRDAVVVLGLDLREHLLDRRDLARRGPA